MLGNMKSILPIFKKNFKPEKPKQETDVIEKDEIPDYDMQQRRTSSLGACNHGNFKIVVLGDDGVGKTALCEQFSGYESEISENGEEVYDTGIFVTINTLKRQYDLEIFDINIDNSKENPTTYKQRILSADGFILVYSKDQKNSFIKVFEILTDIKHFTKHNIPLIVVGTKSELSKKFIKVSQDDIKTLETKHMNLPSNDKEKIENVFRTLVHDCILKKESTRRRGSAPALLKKSSTLSNKVIMEE